MKAWVIFFAIGMVMASGVGCSKTPDFTNLQGEWRQESDPALENDLIEAIGEAFDFESFELCFRDEDNVAMSTIIGTGEDGRRVYWETAYKLSEDSKSNYFFEYRDHNHNPTKASITFEKEFLILQQGKKRRAFIRARASNLRIKGFYP